MDLKEKVIVITGGTGVLGGAFADAVHQTGGKICILGRNMELAEERAHHIISNGGSAIAIKADVMNETDLEKAFIKITNHFGQIDGLVNGAGGNMPEGILDPSEDVFELNVSGMKRVMELNLWGTILPTQIFGRAMANEKGGSIVNISSMSSRRVITKVLGYSMGKAAIDCYTQWFATELANRYGDKVRMNAIAPGFFLTEQNRNLLALPDGSYTERGQLVLRNTPYKRFGKPEELTGALIWLLSDQSIFVTGTIIPIDGGFSVFSGV